MLLSLKYIVKILISKLGSIDNINQISPTIKEKIKLSIHYSYALYSLIRFKRS
jgi:hypothetical protein